MCEKDVWICRLADPSVLWITHTKPETCRLHLSKRKSGRPFGWQVAILSQSFVLLGVVGGWTERARPVPGDRMARSYLVRGLAHLWFTCFKTCSSMRSHREVLSVVLSAIISKHKGARTVSDLSRLKWRRQGSEYRHMPVFAHAAAAR